MIEREDAFERWIETAHRRLEALERAGSLERGGEMPLAAAHEELAAALEELQVAGEELHQQNEELVAVRDHEGQLTGLRWSMRDVAEHKRARELSCLYALSRLVEQPGISLDEICQKTVELIPAAWQYPDITCSRIITEGREFRTDNFKETAWMQRCPLIVQGQAAGVVEVGYLEARPASEEGPFLKDERDLLYTVAERVKRAQASRTRATRRQTGRRSRQPMPPPAATLAQPAAPDARLSRPLRILLAEDDEINQRVARAVLEQAGHQVMVVGDGRAALAALETCPVDMVFMDVQMPGMDGLAATAAIRADPRWAHLPIVAMTAHAMKRDREVCLATGMDDYISKPLHVEELTTAIARQARRIRLLASEAPPAHQMAHAPGAAAPSSGEASPIPIDRASALERLGGNVTQYDTLLRLWLHNAPPEIERLAQATERGDSRVLESAAHKLKGMSAYVGAEGVRQAALRMELLGRSGELSEAPAALAKLQQEFKRAAELAARS